jgi:hypothetical protein
MCGHAHANNRPNHFRVPSDSLHQFLTKKTCPSSNTSGLLDLSSQRALKVEQVAVEAALVRELGEHAGVVGRYGVGSISGFRAREATYEKTQAVLFSRAFEYPARDVSGETM